MSSDFPTGRELEFLILGPFEIRSGDHVLPLRSAKQRALLAILLLHPNEVVSSDRLIDDLWHEKPPETATNLLQVHVSQLRKLLDPERNRNGGPLVTRAPGYLLDLDPLQLDSVRFERLVNEGIAALAMNEPERALASLERSLALWRGPALAEFAFEEFARLESGRLEELRLLATEERVEAALALGRHAALVGELDALVSEHPGRERLGGQLMLALYRSGRQEEALEAYNRTRKRLVDDLGIEPSPDLQRLLKAILNQDSSLDLPERESARPAKTEATAPPPEKDDASPPQATRKTVTVLFAAFVLAPTRSETIEPETLEPVFARLGEALTTVVERHGGSIHWSSEIEIVAVFGIPRVHEDDALRAVRAAVELRDAIAAVSARLGRDFGVGVDVRMGVNTGQVVSGVAFAAPAMGGASSVAAGLGRASAVGEILIADATKNLVRDAVSTESAQAAGATAWRLLDVLSGAAGIERRLSSPTVGRDHELETLRRAFQSVERDDTASLTTVFGPAGIGKSHLAHAFVTRIGGECRVLEGRCPAYGEGSTFAPLADIVRELGGDEPLETIRSIVSAELDADAITERIAAAIGLSTSGGQTETTFWAVRKLFEALARERTLVIVLDDLHWAEPTFLELVENVVDWTIEAPIFVLGLARPDLLEERPAWAGGKPNVSSVVLEPLDEHEAQALVDNLLDGATLERERRTRIIEAAGGNPFFLEQLLAMETPEAGSAPATSVPPTIQALLAARLDRLEPAQHGVMQHGSIMGVEFWRSALEALGPEGGGEPLGQALRELVRKQLVEPCRPSIPVSEALRFHSLLIRDAVYESVPKRVRAVWHERLAGWLAQSVGEQVGRYEEVLGHHLEQAFRYHVELGPLDDHAREIGREGAEYLRSAGRRAFARGDMDVAAGLLRRAAALMHRDDPVRLALLPTIGEALHETGAFASAREVLDEALRASLLREDSFLEGKARLMRALVDASSATAGEEDFVVREAVHSSAVFAEAGDHAALATACRMLAWAHGTAGRYGDAVRAAGLAIKHSDTAGDRRQHGRAATLYAMAALHGPTPVPEAIDRCRSVVEDVAGDRRADGLVTSVVGWLEAMRGDFDEARALAEQGRAILLDLGSGVRAPSLFSSQIEMLAGDPAAAEADLRRDFDALTELGETYLRSTVACDLAQAVYAQGRYDEALELSVLAEGLAAPDDVTSQSFWRSVRAKVLARRGKLDEALPLAAEAVELLRHTDALVTRARALVDQAEVFELAGDHDEARARLNEAVALLDRKDSVVGVRQAEQRLHALSSTPPVGTGA